MMTWLWIQGCHFWIDNRQARSWLSLVENGCFLLPNQSLPVSFLFGLPTVTITPSRLDRGVRILVLVLSVPLSFLSKIVGN